MSLGNTDAYLQTKRMRRQTTMLRVHEPIETDEAVVPIDETTTAQRLMP
jgi:hypothetical protein